MQSHTVTKENHGQESPIRSALRFPGAIEGFTQEQYFQLREVLFKRNILTRSAIAEAGTQPYRYEYRWISKEEASEGGGSQLVIDKAEIEQRMKGLSDAAKEKVKIYYQAHVPSFTVRYDGSHWSYEAEKQEVVQFQKENTESNEVAKGESAGVSQSLSLGMQS